MANFKTHLMVGCMASGVIATSLVTIHLATSSEAILVFVSGTIGALLPDIDSDNSIPIRLAFNVAGLLVGFMALLSLQGMGHYSIVESLLVWGGGYLVIRYPCFYAFTKFSVHRGIFHSLPAAVFFGFLWAILLYDVANFAAFSSLLSGATLAIGYIVHLLLDESYSVDLFGMTIKRSFGTALKLFSFRYWAASLALYAATIALFFFLPPHEQFLRSFLDPNTYSTLAKAIFPHSLPF